MCLKQWIPCIIRISIFGAVLAGKKCVLYTGKYGIIKQGSYIFGKTLISLRRLPFGVNVMLNLSIDDLLLTKIFKDMFVLFFRCCSFHSSQWILPFPGHRRKNI